MFVFRYLANMNLKSENRMRNMILVEIRRILYQGSSDRLDILIFQSFEHHIPKGLNHQIEYNYV